MFDDWLKKVQRLPRCQSAAAKQNGLQGLGAVPVIPLRRRIQSLQNEFGGIPGIKCRKNRR